MGLITKLFVNLWNRISGLLPDLDPVRLHTGTAWVTFLAAGIVCAVFLIVRTYGYSRAILALKEKSWSRRGDKTERRKLRRRFFWLTMLGLIFTAALSFILVYYVYPRIPGLVASASSDKELYADILNEVRRRKLLMVILGYLALVAWPAFIWAFSRRFVSKGVRTFVSVMVIIAFISGVITFLVARPKSGASGKLLEVTGNDMVSQANNDYRAGSYERAKAVYTTLTNGGPDTDLSREDLLNNLALAQMQLGENRQALATMRKVVSSSDATPYHVINLLTAAHINGISSGEILEDTGAIGLLKDFAVVERDKKDSVRLRNAIAYNVAYMDMELDEEILEKGTSLEFLFPDRTGFTDEFRAVSPKAEDAYNDLSAVLDFLQEDCKATYGGEDSDITALSAYLEARIAGGEPVVEEE